MVCWQVVGILKPSRLRTAVVGVLRSSRSDNGSGTVLLQPRNPRLPQMVVSLDALDMGQQADLRRCASHCCAVSSGWLFTSVKRRVSKFWTNFMAFYWLIMTPVIRL